MKNIPAFPSVNKYREVEGMTLKNYACIKLKVPESDDDWLNKLILKSLRTDLAAKAMQGELACQTENWNYESNEMLAKKSYEIADAMIKEREK